MPANKKADNIVLRKFGDSDYYFQQSTYQMKAEP